MTSTLDRFRMALAMQSNCFSLDRVENMLCVTLRVFHLPSGEVFTALRHGRLKVVEHVDVDTVFRRFRVSGRDQVNTTQCLILITINDL
jgi:hypothetical protein